MPGVPLDGNYNCTNCNAILSGPYWRQHPNAPDLIESFFKCTKCFKETPGSISTEKIEYLMPKISKLKSRRLKRDGVSYYLDETIRVLQAELDAELLKSGIYKPCPQEPPAKDSANL